MTTAIIIALIVLIVIVALLGVWVWQLQVLASALRRRSEWFEQAAGRFRKDVNDLATVVAKNASRTTRLEGEDAPRRPASPATYIATTYPKRADEV